MRVRLSFKKQELEEEQDLKDKGKKRARKILKIEIVIPKLSPIVYEFLGYLADQAGLLSLIYQEILDKANVDIDSQ